MFTKQQAYEAWCKSYQDDNRFPSCLMNAAFHAWWNGAPTVEDAVRIAAIERGTPNL